MGIISLNCGISILIIGDYLILITKRQKVGNLKGHLIYKIQDYSIIKIQRKVEFDPLKQQDDEKYLKMLHLIMKMDYYYSNTRDLTRSYQSQSKVKYGSNVPLYARADERFFWNFHLLQKFISNQQDDVKKQFILEEQIFTSDNLWIFSVTRFPIS